jgi:hypothetical protein
MAKHLNHRFRVLSKLVKLYPPDFKAEFTNDLLQTTADLLDHAPTPRAKARVWLRIAADLPLSLVSQQLTYAGETLMKDTPTYLKVTSLISGLMLLPFLAALISNGLDRVLYNHTLYGSWLWHAPFLRLWVLILPETAFILAAAGFLTFVLKRSQQKSDSWRRRLLGLSRTWPVLLPGVAAFGVLFILAFHDSAQCWVKNPVSIATHLPQAWQCSANNESLPAFKHFL